MSEKSFGFFTGVTGFALVATGVLLALLAGLRMLWVIRRPNRGHVARGIAAGGLVLALCGALLFTVEEVGEGAMRNASDRLWHVLAGLSLLVSVFVGVRAARRRPSASLEPSAPASAEPSEAEPRKPAESRGA